MLFYYLSASILFYPTLFYSILFSIYLSSFLFYLNSVYMSRQRAYPDIYTNTTYIYTSRQHTCLYNIYTLLYSLSTSHLSYSTYSTLYLPLIFPILLIVRYNMFFYNGNILPEFCSIPVALSFVEFSFFYSLSPGLGWISSS